MHFYSIFPFCPLLKTSYFHVQIIILLKNLECPYFFFLKALLKLENLRVIFLNAFIIKSFNFLKSIHIKLFVGISKIFYLKIFHLKSETFHKSREICLHYFWDSSVIAKCVILALEILLKECWKVTRKNLQRF